MTEKAGRGGCLKWGLAVGGGLFLLTVIGLGAAGDERAAQEERATQGTQEAQAETIAAPDLAAAFDRNEVAAKSRFADRPLRITGTIRSIDLDILGNPQMQLASGGQFDYVLLAFGKEQADAVALLEPGREISVLCREGASEVLGNPYAQDCVIG